MGARKVLLLGIVLLLPVLAFLFLNTFGRNAYKLRTYLPEREMPGQVGAQPVLAGDTTYHRVADDVALMAASGQPFNPARDLRGHSVVLAFAPANAESTPTGRRLLGQLARVQERFRAEPAVKLLLLSPEAPAVLAPLAERVGTIAGKWTLAHAEPATLTDLRHELRETAPVEADGRVWLLDADRHLRGFYDVAADPRETDRLLTEISVLLEITQPPFH